MSELSMCSKMPYRTKIDQLVKTVIDVRKTFEKRVGTGTNLCGYCIEASEEIVERLTSFDLSAKTVEGYVIYDDPYCGYEYMYDAHTWVEAYVVDSENKRTSTWYIDITGDQFNCGRLPETKLSGIIIQQFLPYGYVNNRSKKAVEQLLERLGIDNDL